MNTKLPKRESWENNLIDGMTANQFEPNGIIDETYGDLSYAQMNTAAIHKEFVRIFHSANDFYVKKNTVTDNAIPDACVMC